MDSVLVGTIVGDVLWVLVAVGWFMLVVTGLETDKPLSGGIPGHLSPDDMHEVASENFLGRLGTAGAWVLFGLVCATLPVVLWWIFQVHPQ